MNKVMIAGVVIALAVSCGAAIAADAVAGKSKYIVCAGCHGPTGAGNDAMKYPKLAGRSAIHVVEQLKAFKSGKRDNATMKQMALMLNDADIQNVAAYIATLK